MPNQFVKLLVSFLLMSFLVVGLTAQDKCDLQAAPGLLKLNLGMSPAEVSNVFGKDLNIKLKNTGERIFFQNYINKPATNSLRGIRALYLRFLDGGLYQIEIFYEDRADWQTLSDFTANLAAQMSFPENLWQVKQNRALVNCGTFNILADKVLNPRVELTDETIRAKIEILHKKKS